MKKSIPIPWERIERVIRYSGAPSINAFSLGIGLSRSENLYQIKKGNNGISMALAERIHAHYPAFSILWLLCGDASEQGSIALDGGRMKKIAYYDVIPAGFSTNRPLPDKYLTLSAPLCHGATMATLCRDGALHPRVVRSSILLLKESPGEIVYGNIYLIETAQHVLLRIVRRMRMDGQIRLTTLQRTDYDEIIINRNDILAMYFICASITNFCM